MSSKKSFVKCVGCENFFEKENKYIKQSIKRNMKHFCSASCQMHYRRRTDPRFQVIRVIPPEKLKLRKKDEYSPFRYYLRKAKTRNKCQITIEEIKEQWDIQNGLCNYTKLPMKPYKEHTNKFDLASLDRIDSKKPYQKGNIQFIICALNLAKNSENDKDFVNFLKQISRMLASS